MSRRTRQGKHRAILIEMAGIGPAMTTRRVNLNQKCFKPCGRLARVIRAIRWIPISSRRNEFATFGATTRISITAPRLWSKHIPRRHGRACPGHPRLWRRMAAKWVPATIPGSSPGTGVTGQRLRPVRRSSPRVRGEGRTARRKTQFRLGEGALPQAQTRGGAPSSRPSPRARGEGVRGTASLTAITAQSTA
jgi:hypothetical protein